MNTVQTVKYTQKIYRHSKRINSLTQTLPKNNLPILIGPWLGEVGPELLYWIPYLLKIREEGWFENHRLIAISRGGVDAWYQNIVDEYVDVFDFLTTEEFRDINHERVNELKVIKQISWQNSEKSLIQKIAHSKKYSDFLTLHPSIMWSEVFGHWNRDSSIQKPDFESLWNILSPQKFIHPVEKHTRKVTELNLPEKYIAAKFYFSDHSFPKTEKNIRFIQETLKHFSQKMPIVSMGIPHIIDDHESFIPQDSFNIIDISNKLKLASNLGVQTEILRRSCGFIGSHGGFVILAAFLDKADISFYGSDKPLKNNHEPLISRLFQEFKQPYIVLETHQGKTLMEMF
ncbi:MAG: hypothetical protein HQM12_17625 [SAR324 cluster bacterium]|nr:hypothetical protein [SAR324 cluster bacterium]